jgi:hypothetical protein
MFLNPVSEYMEDRDMMDVRRVDTNIEQNNFIFCTEMQLQSSINFMHSNHKNFKPQDQIKTLL